MTCLRQYHRVARRCGRPLVCPFRGTSIPRFWRSSGSGYLGPGRRTPATFRWCAMKAITRFAAARGWEDAGPSRRTRCNCVSNVCRHRQSQLAHRLRPCEEHRLSASQLGVRPERPADCRAAFREESVPGFGAHGAGGMERIACSPGRGTCGESWRRSTVGRSYRHRTTCSSESTRRSTISTGRRSWRFTWRITTSAWCIQVFGHSSIRPTCGRRCTRSAASDSIASR